MPRGNDSRIARRGPATVAIDGIVLQRFMSLGPGNRWLPKNVRLAAVVEDALSLVRPACVHAGIDLEFQQPAESLQVCGDPEALGQLTVNLVINAVEAVSRHNGGRGRIVVALESVRKFLPLSLRERKRRTPLSMGPGVRDFAALHVRDTGPGPPPQLAVHPFEPFVSGSPEGTGLGLYVARQIAEGHHGSIHWQRENDMTCFTVELPLLANEKDKDEDAG